MVLSCAHFAPPRLGQRTPTHSKAKEGLQPASTCACPSTNKDGHPRHSGRQVAPRHAGSKHQPNISRTATPATPAVRDGRWRRPAICSSPRSWSWRCHPPRHHGATGARLETCPGVSFLPHKWHDIALEWCSLESPGVHLARVAGVAACVAVCVYVLGCGIMLLRPHVQVPQDQAGLPRACRLRRCASLPRTGGAHHGSPRA